MTTWLDRVVWLTLALIAISLTAHAAEAVMRAGREYTITIRPVEPCRLAPVEPGALSSNPLRAAP